MSHGARIAFLVFAICVAAQAQPDSPPRIFEGGVVNAASFAAPPAPGSGLAQGSLISIFGTSLGPEPGVSAEQFPLAQELAGVSVEIQTSQGLMAAIPIFVSSGQINVLLPSQTPVGLNSVSVRRNGAAGNFIFVNVVRNNVGLFSYGSGVVRTAAAQRFLSETEQPLAMPEAPARPGETIVLWGTGLGPVPGPETAAAGVIPLDTPIEVSVGHQSAAIDYQGRAPAYAGVDQINIRIPGNAPLGCFVPVWVNVRGALFSNIVTIPISADGGPCHENPTLPPSLAGAPSGRVLLQRSVELDGAMNPVEATTSDLATAAFRAPAAALAALHGPGQAHADALPPLHGAQIAVLPPEGTCLVYASPASTADEGHVPLDAGESIAIDGPAGRASIPREQNGYRLEAPPGLLFLGAGPYRIESAGGLGFPPFSATISAGEPARWSTSGAEPEPRLSGASLAWELPQAPPDSILVTGRDMQIPGADLAGSASTRFVCVAPNTADSFAIPAAVLANLPESTADLELASVWGPKPLEFPTDGPEVGSLAYLHSQRSRTRFGAPHLPSTPVRLPSGAEIQAELAATFTERQRGLMFRRDLPPGQGMLFLFESPGRHSFWMLNTLVPLDIIWMDDQRRIVFISENTPPCPPDISTLCPTYGGGELAQFVIELAAGQAAVHSLAVGDRLDW